MSRWVLVLGEVLLLLGLSGVVAPSEGVAQQVSEEGRFVVFDSDSSRLVPGDTNGSEDVFVRDRSTGTTERVSVSSEEEQGNTRDPFGSFGGAISANGRYVAFTSPASNLVPGDTNGSEDVFVRDRSTGTTERVSVSSEEEQGNTRDPFGSFGGAISASGRYVAFISDASNLVPGDANGTTEFFVRDRVEGTTERVSVSSEGVQSDGDSSDPPVISASGRYVAFDTNGNLVPDDTNTETDVFVRDRVEGTTERVSVSSEGVQANATSFALAISANGRYVAFASDASNLIPGDTNGTMDIFVRDHIAGTTERVNVSSEGTRGGGVGFVGWLSADGRFVAFSSNASNLVPGDTNGWVDVFLRDRVRGTTERVSVGTSGKQGDSYSGRTAQGLSADGRYVAFDSEASNLVPGDTNGASDVFLRDRVRGTTELVSVSIRTAEILPYTGLPLLVIAALGALLAVSGLVLRRLGSCG